MDEAKEVTTVLLGDSGCGKSTFIQRLSRGSGGAVGLLPTSKQEEQPCVYDVRIYNRFYRFIFHHGMSEAAYAALDPSVVIFCYDIGNKQSLANARKVWLPLHLQTHHKEIPFILLGLKRDLRTEAAETISPQEAHALAQDMRCDRWVECSATTGEFVRETFEDIALICAKTTTKDGFSSDTNCLIL